MKNRNGFFVVLQKHLHFCLQSVATIGSTLTTVQHDVKTMQAAFENQKKDDDLKKTMVLLSHEYYFIRA